jgi:hypothetical protein
VVSAAKGLRRSQGEDLYDIGELLHVMLQPPPAPGQQPWYAASPERREFVWLVLARLGGWAGARFLVDVKAAQGPGSGPGRLGCFVPEGEAEIMCEILGHLQAAGQQLGRQPLLRQQLEVAAPALVVAADAAAAIEQGYTTQSHAGGVLVDLAPQPLQLLADLGQQLDPLALGLRLPGCYSPACTALAGASEADLPLKICAGCKVARCVCVGGRGGDASCHMAAWACLAISEDAADSRAMRKPWRRVLSWPCLPAFRYCGPACAKAHWKHHKASCKAASAAQQAQEQP